MKMRGDFVLLYADSLRLLVPQREVSSTEYIDQVPVATLGDGIFAMGLEATQEVRALSEQMHWLHTFPSDRSLLTRFTCAPQKTALAWNEVRVLIDVELEFHPLPAVMQGGGELIDAYVEIDKGLAFCTSSQRLLPEMFAHPD